MAVYFHEEDLPEGVLAPGAVAVDTETMGLITPRDRLCVVQISDGQGDEHLVRFSPGSSYAAPNLKAVLADPSRVKLYHFARFDLAAIEHYLGVVAAPVFCTKIASKLVRTYTDRHGLKDLVRELLGKEISKQQQSSDWGGPVLSDAQQEYAASDVRHLHAMHAILVERLEREGRTVMAQACFDFLPMRARLDLAGWAERDIFSHADMSKLPSRAIATIGNAEACEAKVRKEGEETRTRMASALPDAVRHHEANCQYGQNAAPEGPGPLR
ncbi:3'-5' exonuclease [Novosphingobium subterraneum]|uniref:3'-5' exonuclease n=2 Tax=Novosphingobium subterraneum TaxID=48936 RepID=A0A0B8ZB84_9SPHN|nr:3'-5' exonuclease [Novosphingobium subterraneum]